MPLPELLGPDPYEESCPECGGFSRYGDVCSRCCIDHTRVELWEHEHDIKDSASNALEE